MKTYSSIVALILLAVTGFSQEWEQVSSLPNDFQTHHSFAFAIDGTGYIVTGVTAGSGTKNFYQYDPDEDRWTRLDDFPGSGRGYAIGDVWDGKAYFGFGSNSTNYLNDFWVYDPGSDAWTLLADCECTSREHPALVAHEGKIYVGMGNDLNQGNLNDWWQYDIATNTWEQKANFPGVRRHHPYQFAIGDYVYAGFGHGASVYKEWYRYDPDIDEWQQVADIPGEGRVAGQQFSYNDKGYILSGDGDDHSYMDTGEFWSYDPEIDAWEEMPPHPGTARWAPASFVLNGEAYIINGVDKRQGIIANEIYKFNLDGVATSTQGVDHNLSIDVFPNPFQDQINIRMLDLVNTETLQTTVYDIQNRKVYSSNGLSENLNLAFLPSGIFRLEIKDENNYYNTLISKF